MNKMVDKVLRGDGLKMRAIRMSGLGAFGKGGVSVLRLIGNVILASLLFPEAFGLMALVALITGAAGLFSDVGIHDSLVRSPRGDDRAFRDTAWTLQILRGFLLAAIVVAISGPFAALYDEEMLGSLLTVAALQFVITGFNSTKVANARRHLAIGRVTVMGLMAKVVSVITMVLLAWATGSVWSLVIGMLFGALFRCALSHLYLPGKLDRPLLERAAVWEIFALGRFILVGTAATYVSSRAMTAILGLFLTLGTLGQFNMALALASLPGDLGYGNLNQVLLSLFSKRPSDGDGARSRSRRKARRIAAALSGAMIVGFALVAPPVINLLYDERYALMAPFTVLLCIALSPKVIYSGYGASILARGDGPTHMYAQLIGAVGQVAFVSVGIVTSGVLGAIIGSAIARLAPMIVVFPAQRRAGELDAGFDVLLSLGLCVAAAAICWVHWPQIELLLEANGDTMQQP